MGEAQDRESQDWIDGLGGAGKHRAAAQARLHGVLLRMASLELRRRGMAGAGRPGGPGLAQQAAASALTAITRNISGYRGGSKFTAFAGKHVMFAVSEAAGGEYWRTRPAQADASPGGRSDPGWDLLMARIGSEASNGDWDDMVASLRFAVDEVLTMHQRTVFTAVLLSDLPAEALTSGLGPSRNAIYQALFEARRRIAARLAADGQGPRRLQLPHAGARWLARMLAAEAGDAGCDTAFGVLDRYAEAELAGQQPGGRFPGVHVHLASCSACRQDYEGLLAAIGA